MPRVFVTIVTYNGRAYIEELLRSLTTELDAECGCIVVDNASTDGTASWIANNAPGVLLIANATNAGFTGGQNMAMREAMKRGAEYVILLNQDMVVERGLVKTLVAAADTHPHASALQPLILLHGEDRVNSWGNEQHFLGFGYAGGYKEPVARAPKTLQPITYASGAAVLYRVSALNHVGLFPDHFFMYQEDLDMSWRMRLAGYDILLVPDARVYHKYDWQGAAKKYSMVERNRLATVYANYHWATLILLFPGLVLAELGLLVISFFTGWHQKKREGYCLLMDSSYRRAVQKARAQAQALRIVSDRTITDSFTPIIDFQETKSSFTRFMLNPCFWVYWKLVRMAIFW